MPLDFPNSPTIGQIFFISGVNWMWDGIKWSYVAVPAQSVILVSASSQYLSRTWAGAYTLATKGTVAFWFKRTAISNSIEEEIYDGGPWVTNGSPVFRFPPSSNVLEYIIWDGSSILSQNSFPTPNGTDTNWHHICLAWDSTIPLVQLWTDGNSPGNISTSVGLQFHFSDVGITSAIGRVQTSANRYFNGKLAYFYLIDGTAMTAADFITGTGAGTCHPKIYTGSYGNHGFFLNFSGSNGNDNSGVNSNNWTLNGSPTFSSDVPT